ncbi:MAG TPA: SIMPL domain-containing protein [Pseudonocardiaceae bacterium]|nr:SIMPL domain-containing protein [Pseudonocardiaceae bacterium]
MPLTVTVTRRTAVTGLLATAALVGAFVAGNALSGPNGVAPVAFAATPTARPADGFPGITVTGLGQVTGVPDVLSLGLSVRVTRGDASSALSDASSTMNKVRASLTGSGVADADLATSGLTLDTDYRYDNNRQTVNGYVATESLTAKLRDLARAGAAITAAANAGGNPTAITGVTFDLRDNTALLSAARTAAFADAKAKATQYATAAGRSLGPVIRVNETTDNQPIPVPRNAAGASVPVPVNPGTSQLSVTVEVVFGLN